VTLQLISLINRVQTIDAVDLDPFETQQRVGTTVTSEIATAVALKKIQCNLLEGGTAKWADAEGTSLVKPTGASVEVGGDGAAEFTSLDDAPGTITPMGVVVGNDAGTALRMSDIISINENGVFQIIENGDSGIAVAAHGAGGFSVLANGDGGVTLSSAGGPGASTLRGGEGGVTVACIEDAQVSINGTGDSGVVINGTGAYGLALNAGGPGLSINSEVAVPTQSVLVAGVGTMVFTHGILTSFTPV
jgi:hypothetical protein